MTSDLRIRLTPEVRVAANAAATKRGVSLNAFVALTIYEHLRTCGELGKPTPGGLHVPPDLDWFISDDTDEKTTLDAEGRDWSETEVNAAYAQGRDILEYY